MTTIAANLSVSLDGCFAGPGASPAQMLGTGGEILHRWFAHDVADRAQLSSEEVLRPEFERAGAMIMGGDSYEIAETARGPHPPFEVSNFVLTHRARGDEVREATAFTVVTDGLDAAIERARAAAGDKDVMLHGGTAIQQGLRAGVLEELQLHVVPVLLGRGAPAAGGLRRRADRREAVADAGGRRRDAPEVPDSAKEVSMDPRPDFRAAAADTSAVITAVRDRRGRTSTCRSRGSSSRLPGSRVRRSDEHRSGRWTSAARLSTRPSAACGSRRAVSRAI